MSRGGPDVLKSAGIVAGAAPRFGDSRSAVLHEIDCERALAAQKVSHAVGVRCSVTLSNGKTLGPGEQVTPAMLTPGPNAPKGVTGAVVLAELVRVGVVTVLDALTVFERNIPAEVEFAAFREVAGKGGKIIPPGTAVREEDFEPLPEPPPLTMVEQVAEEVLRRLGQPTQHAARVSDWDQHRRLGSIVRNPRYQRAREALRPEQ